MTLLVEFWPFWLGAIALSLAAGGHALTTGRGLGVSGRLNQVLDPEERRAALEDPRADLDDEAYDAALEEALRQATLEAFGEAAAAAATTDDRAPAEAPAAPPLTWGSSLAFLLAVVGGGAISGTLDDEAALGIALDPAFVARVADGPAGLAVLLLGGILVGAGTQASGGCTSGHGLIGVSRLQPGSLVATATFFGTGVATALLLQALS